jgi:ribosome silencing factor RsfS/YbeB/iojap
MAVEAAVDQRGIDVVALDVRPEFHPGEGFRAGSGCSFADYFVIISGTSNRHVKGIADKIEARLSAVGEKPFHVTGLDTCEWVVLDYGNLVVHVFYEPSRQYYGLDQFWRERGSVIPPSPELANELRQLRTGMFG